MLAAAPCVPDVAPPALTHLYRYEVRSYSVADENGDHSHSRQELSLFTFAVLRQTPKGAWIHMGWSNAQWEGNIAIAHTPAKRFVLLTARKRFACPTKVEALESFLARNAVAQSIMRARLAALEQAARMARQEIDLSQRGIKL